MNKVVLVGNLVKDPELLEINGVEDGCVKFTIAVRRNYKTSEGTAESDFFPVVMWGQRGKVIHKYLKKGDYISISGKLRTRSYETKDEQKRFVVEVIADEFDFCGWRKQTGSNGEVV